MVFLHLQFFQEPPHGSEQFPEVKQAVLNVEYAGATQIYVKSCSPYVPVSSGCCCTVPICPTDLALCVLSPYHPLNSVYKPTFINLDTNQLNLASPPPQHHIQTIITPTETV